MEDGSRPGKAAPVPTGDMQHHLKTRCGPVVCSREVSGTDRADSVMGGGTGEVCRPGHGVQRKWMECETVPG